MFYCFHCYFEQVNTSWVKLKNYIDILKILKIVTLLLYTTSANTENKNVLTANSL